MRDKADWAMQGPHGRPVYAGARYLSNKGKGDHFVGRYLILRDRPDVHGNTEYGIWRDSATRALYGDILPSYWFYLMVWTDGPDGPVLQWAVVDMPHWAALEHVLVTKDPDTVVAADGADAWKGRIPYDRKVNADGTPFVRFPMRLLKQEGVW